MKSLGYVHTPIADHHRWSPYSKRSIATGRGMFNRTARLMLHQMRWRKPPRQYGLMTVSALLSLLVHLVGLTLMVLVRPPPVSEPVPLGQPNAIQVRFIDSHPPPPPPPAVAPLPKPRTAPARKTPRTIQRVVRQPVVRPSQAPRLAAVPVPAPVVPRPVTRIKVTPPKIKITVTPVTPVKVPKVAAVAPRPVPKKAPPPVKAAPTPVKAEPAIALPPPPRVVLEKSSMSLPPPKISVTEATPFTASEERPVPEQPIALARPQQVSQAPEASTLDVGTVQPELPDIASVQAAPEAPPEPDITVTPLAVNTTIEPQPAPAAPASVPVQPASLASVALVQPAPATRQALPAAPVLSPQVHIELAPASTSAPPVQALSPQLATVSDLPQVAAPATVPAPASSAPATPATPIKPSTSTTPSVAVASPAATQPATNWALQSDTFGKTPIKQPGHGTADQRQAGQGSPNGVPDYIQRQPQGNSNVMTRHYRGFHYKRTIFDQYWAPQNQTLLTSLLQKLVDVLSFKKTFDLGHGVRIHCGGWLLGFGCGGDPPDGPSRLSGDRRLNMAPASPLAPGLGSSAPKPLVLPSPVSSKQTVDCETARVSGGPLPPGCKAAKGALGNWK